MPRRSWQPAVSHRYVVDASVATAANRGKPGESERARACRTYMMTIMKACHRLAMTEHLKAEWDGRASNWSKDWFLSMARKGKVRWVVPDGCEDVSAEIDGGAYTDDERSAMKKDVHLVAAAMRASRRIVSLDSTAAALFTRVAAEVNRIGGVAWIDPTTDELPPHRN